MYFALLDILRFLSAIAVLFHHTFYFYHGKLGIYLFFIISGFVIHFSLKKGVKDYIISRFLRLFPLFWVCCTITYLVTLYYGVNLPFKNYLISMLLVNDGKIASMVDGSYWTLTFEVLFYFYVGVFVWLFSTKNLVWFYASWLTISFLCFFLAVDQHIIAKLLSIRFAPYFIFGGVLALIVENWKNMTRKMAILYSVLLTLAALMPVYVSKKLLDQKATITNFTGSFDSTEMVIILSFFILIPSMVYLSTFPFANTKKFKVLCLTLGGITYPLYLLHWKVGQTLIEAYGFTYTEINYFSIGVALGLTVISYFLAKYELPARKYIKEKFFNW